MYIIENNRSIRSISIVRKEGHMAIIRFDDSGGGMRISENRIFNSKEEGIFKVTWGLTHFHLKSMRWYALF